MSVKKSCIVCGKESKFQCSACRNASYCSREHQRQDWKNHKPKCAFQRLLNASGIQSINFSEIKKSFPLLDWNDYFFKRHIFSQAITPTLLSNPFVEQLTDGLSYPLSILYAFQQIGIKPKTGIEHQNFIYIVGANSSVEEAQMDDQILGAKCWAELGAFYPESMFGLVVIGPQLSQQHAPKVRFISRNVFATFICDSFENWVEGERSMARMKKEDVSGSEKINEKCSQQNSGFDEKERKGCEGKEDRTNKMEDINKKENETDNKDNCIHDDDDVEVEKPLMIVMFNPGLGFVAVDESKKINENKDVDKKSVEEGKQSDVKESESCSKEENIIDEVKDKCDEVKDDVEVKEKAGTSETLSKKANKYHLPSITEHFSMPCIDPWERAFEEVLRFKVPVLITFCNDEDDSKANIHYLQTRKACFVTRPRPQPNPFSSRKTLHFSLSNTSSSSSPESSSSSSSSTSSSSSESVISSSWVKRNHSYVIVNGAEWK